MKPYNIAIATSGYFPDKTVKSAENLLFTCNESNFIFGLPIEGIGKINDEIRGVEGFFNKTTNLPRWVLKIIMIFHNILYNVLSFFKIGDEMIVVAKMIKK